MSVKNYLSLFLIIVFTFTVSAQKRVFTIEDLYKVKNVGSPVLSNKGDKIAFTVTEYDLPKGKTINNIYLMNTNGSSLVNISEKMTGADSPIWSSNDELYFVFNGQVYKHSFETNENTQITDFYAGVSDPVLSNDGRYIAFTAELFPECGVDNNCNKD